MTENIEKFLQTAYTDEKLAALLAHAQDGKLAYQSCCCLIGVPSATHALQGTLMMAEQPENFCAHYALKHFSTLEKQAETEFLRIGIDDAARRKALIPLIYAEMERRRIDRLPDISLAEQREREEEDAAEEGALIEASGYPDPQYERNGR